VGTLGRKTFGLLEMSSLTNFVGPNLVSPPWSLRRRAQLIVEPDESDITSHDARGEVKVPLGHQVDSPSKHVVPRASRIPVLVAPVMGVGALVAPVHLPIPSAPPLSLLDAVSGTPEEKFRVEVEPASVLRLRRMQANSGGVPSDIRVRRVVPVVNDDVGALRPYDEDVMEPEADKPIVVNKFRPIVTQPTITMGETGPYVAPVPVYAANTDFKVPVRFGYVRVIRRSLWWVMVWVMLACVCKLLPLFVNVGVFQPAFVLGVVVYTVLAFGYCMWWFAPCMVRAIRYTRVRSIPNRNYEVRPSSFRHAPNEFQQNADVYRCESRVLYLGWLGWFRMLGVEGLTFEQIEHRFVVQQGGYYVPAWDINADMDNRVLRPLAWFVSVCVNMVTLRLGALFFCDEFVSSELYISRTIVSALATRKRLKPPDVETWTDEARRMAVSVNIDSTDVDLALNIVEDSVRMSLDMAVHKVARMGWNWDHHFQRGAAPVW